MKNTIVVGYDGSAGSVEAAQWAASEAALRDVTLRVLTCCAPPFVADWTYAAGAVRYDIRDAGGAALVNAAHIIERIHDVYPGLATGVTVAVGAASERLTEASSTADLVVVGQTAGRLKRLFACSVAQPLTHRSHCPVVVVPAGSTRQPLRRRVVVGVDGSDAALAALEWAVDEAKSRSAALVVVHAWRSSGARNGTRGRSRADAQVILNRAVTGARGRGSRVVEGHLVEGSAAWALVLAAEDADLIVVGARVRSIRSLLFGSVVDAVIKRVGRPVAVIHQPSSDVRIGPPKSRQISSSS